MKVVLLAFVVGLTSVACSDPILNMMVDQWLDRVRDLMNATNNRNYPLKGLQFVTKCGALITDMNCTVAAELGVVEDLSTLKRTSAVTVVSTSGKPDSINVDLSFDVLGIHYPIMMISGEGIRITYKGIDASVTSKLPFTVSMALDYSKGIENCSNAFTLKQGYDSKLTMAVTVQEPKATLPADNDLTKNLGNAILQVAENHIHSLLSYEKICTRLATIF